MPALSFLAFVGLALIALLFHGNAMLVHRPSDVGIGPIADISFDHLIGSFDHLIGERDQRGGTVRAEGLATLKLVTKSNLVDCMTGRSASFSPLRIRCSYKGCSEAYPSQQLSY